ncbi:hypothetical protein Taro_053907, partial [Colocasia esculenta]|nr:hypothetical protein [Colocasia esculenta]
MLECEREKRELGAWAPRTLLPLSAQTHSPTALMALTLAQMALVALQPDQLALLVLLLLLLLLLAQMALILGLGQ